MISALIRAINAHFDDLKKDYYILTSELAEFDEKAIKILS